MEKYNHKKIEPKWQKKWQKDGLYKAKDNSKKEKKYILDMFPYPSGEGVHIGHLRGYIPTDTYSRYLRMKGYNVLHPMGWDAFGLPAEGYAIKNKIHPKKAVKKNIDRYRKQLSRPGLSYDWSREIDTTDPDYYKWTQWAFLRMFKKGLAYESYEPINWCPSCKTGLANEDLEGGRCERCDSEVEQKPMRQWVLRITDYAESLLKDLDYLPGWPESVKESQRNWIGKSKGAEIVFPLTYYKEVLLASNNPGKRSRVQSLLDAEGLGIKVLTPKDLGIKEEEVLESAKDLFKNAEKKALAYKGKTELPVLAGDTGFYIKGESLDPTKVKRNAVSEEDEKKLSKEQISRKMVRFYTDIAKKHGGEAEAYWKDAWVLMTPEGDVKKISNKREVVLTAKRKGKVDHNFPLRGLYRHRPSGKHIRGGGHEDSKDLSSVKSALRGLLSYPLEVFTTRPDTLFGATYMVVAPEHKMISELWDMVENKEQVKDYINKAKKKTELQRTAEEKEKTGVLIKGISAINPANGERIPVWMADYVLVHYGTGAIMAVPAHDERDLDFAIQKDLPVRYVVHPRRIDKYTPPVKGKKTVERKTVHAIVSDPKSGKTLFLKWKKHNWRTFVVGGVDEGEDIVEAARREVREETGYTDLKLKKVTPFFVEAHYHAAHKNENRKAYTRAVHFELKSSKQEEIDPKERERHDVEWLLLEEVTNTLTCAELDVWLAWLKEGERLAYAGEGVLENSGNFSGMDNEEAKESIREYVGGKKKITYKLKDWVFSRQRYWGEPIPLVHCDNCGVVPVPENELPVKLPEVKSYEPTGTGESPLANIASWVNTKCPKCKGKAKRETNTMPQWAGSCWYYLRFTDPKNDKALVSSKIEKYWMPVDKYVGGVEHATRHLIYSRFWHKFLYKEGLVSTKEPFVSLRNQGLVLGPDGRKMSKRWGNVVSPDEVVESVGADSMRIYTMFIGPFEGEVIWNPNGPIGAHRFLERVWRLRDKVSSGATPSSKLKTVLNKTIKKVEEDILSFSFNTAVSSLMILVNTLEAEDSVSKKDFKTLLILLAPFAPYISEELWQRLGNKSSVHRSSWPSFDPDLLLEDNVTVAIQINGKTRGEMEIPRDSSEEEVKERVEETKLYAKWCEGRDIKRLVYVPNRLINIVVS
ncbi:MAG: non-canonical purine NTP pyrophosphatase [Patescibacteria group bacterium]